MRSHNFWIPREKKGKHLPSFKILHPICTSCFPELSGARCHLKKEPTRSSDDVRGDSCCLVLPQSKGCHMVGAHRVPSLVAWDDRTVVPLCCARNKVALIVAVDDLLWRSHIRHFFTPLNSILRSSGATLRPNNKQEQHILSLLFTASCKNAGFYLPAKTEALLHMFERRKKTRWWNLVGVSSPTWERWRGPWWHHKRLMNLRTACSSTHILEGWGFIKMARDAYCR